MNLTESWQQRTLIIRADNDSVKGIFRQYEMLTKKSGLELNAEKTEILSMRAGAGGPVQADRTSIFFCHQGNVLQCRKFLSNLKIKVRQCDKFLVMFNYYFLSSFGQVN